MRVDFVGEPLCWLLFSTRDIRAKILFPKQLSGRVEAEQSLGAENGDDAPPVGRGRGIAVRGLGMTLHARHGLGPEAFQRNLPDARSTASSRH